MVSPAYFNPPAPRSAPSIMRDCAASSASHSTLGEQLRLGSVRQKAIQKLWCGDRA